jgi:CTP:molybdopterin cytidylyltransferase MocA
MALGIVPAAGAATRFGGEKLLTDVDGTPMIERTVRALRAGGVLEVVVVVGPDDRAIAALGLPARIAENPDPSRGMLSSIQAGLAAGEGDPIVIIPGDMPYVRPETVRALLDHYAKRHGILSPRYQGKRGHPVLVPASLGSEILAEDPRSATLHDVLRRHEAARADLEVQDPGVVRDVDTRADLRDATGARRS